MDNKEIDEAKLQVQGQMAAQYIQEVMQVRRASHSHCARHAITARLVLSPRAGLFVLWLLLRRSMAARPLADMSSARAFPAQKVTDTCFSKCVTRPGAKLDDSEKVCLHKGSPCTIRMRTTSLTRCNGPASIRVCPSPSFPLAAAFRATPLSTGVHGQVHGSLPGCDGDSLANVGDARKVTGGIRDGRPGLAIAQRAHRCPRSPPRRLLCTYRTAFHRLSVA